MRLTTKGRYAVTAVVDLAFHSEGRPVTLAEIAQRQEISLSYLEQLFARLRRAGIVRGRRGPGGGYLLGRPPERIRIAEIIDAVNEEIDTTQCGGEGNCFRGGPCLTHALWFELNRRIRSYLESVTVADLLQNRDVRTVARWQDAQLQREKEHDWFLE